MKYLVRAIKYFFHLLLILAAILFALVAFKIVDGNLQTMFVHGYDSLWQIAALMAVFALVYPRFGYSTRSLHLPGETAEIRPTVMEAMEAKGYLLQKEEGDEMVFVKRNVASRILSMYEDAATFSRSAYGYDVEGRTKDIVRIVNFIENKSLCD